MNLQNAEQKCKGPDSTETCKDTKVKKRLSSRQGSKISKEGTESHLSHEGTITGDGERRQIEATIAVLLPALCLEYSSHLVGVNKILPC